MSIQITRTNNFESIRRKLAQAPKKSLYVGIIDNATIATIGMYQEYGWVQRVTARQAGWFGYNYGVHLKVGNTLVLPARPFLRGTFESEKDEWVKKVSLSFQKTNSVTDSLAFAGGEAVRDIIQTIRSGGTRKETFAPRSDLTMNMNYANAEQGKKKLKGANTTESTQPLNKTGLLMNSIRYEIL